MSSYVKSSCSRGDGGCVSRSLSSADFQRRVAQTLPSLRMSFSFLHGPLEPLLLLIVPSIAPGT